MDDYEKEYFMVQGFAAAAGSGAGGPGSMLPGSASSEFVSDGQQGEIVFSILANVRRQTQCGSEYLTPKY